MKQFSFVRATVFVIFLLVGGVFLLFEFMGTQTLNNFFYKSLSRINDMYIRGSQFTRTLYENKNQKDVLKEENKNLRSTIDQLTSVLHSQSILEQQNTELRKLLESGYSDEYSLKKTRVVSKIQTNGMNSYLLDIGSKDGVVIDSPAGILSEFDIVVLGFVTRVGKKNSVFTPHSNLGFTIPVVTRKSGILGLMVGQGVDTDLEFLASENSQMKNLIVGEEVLTNAFSKKIPQGLYLGSINELSTNPRTLLPYATVSNPLLVELLDSVIIMLKDSRD